MRSWIQNHVLLELTRHGPRRYSQLRPSSVEGNLFMYHLKGLVREGLVEKGEKDYRLSIKGLDFAGMLSLKTGKTRKQPKILTAVVAANEAGEHLLVRWNREPNSGLRSFPHGMMHYGASTFDMAATELAEKAGLIGELAYRGDVYVRGMRGPELDRHMLVHVFEAADIRPGRQEELRPEIGEAFWGTLDNFKPEDFVPGFYEIAHIVQTQKAHFFEEIVVEIA